MSPFPTYAVTSFQHDVEPHTDMYTQDTPLKKVELPLTLALIALSFRLMESYIEKRVHSRTMRLFMNGNKCFSLSSRELITSTHGANSLARSLPRLPPDVGGQNRHILHLNAAC